jgi:hypothetical protein
MKIFKCKTCDKEINYNSFHYGSGLCISCASKNRKLTKEHKENIRLALLGIPHTSERKENQRKAQIGKKLTQKKNKSY